MKPENDSTITGSTSKTDHKSSGAAFSKSGETVENPTSKNEWQDDKNFFPIVDDDDFAENDQRLDIKSASWTAPENNQDRSTASFTPLSKDKQAEAEREITRLAKLTKLEYEHERSNAAKRLSVRSSQLDRMIALAQSENKAKQGHELNLPEPKVWPEPVSGVDLLNDLSEAIGRYLVMTGHAANVTALWVVHTYLIDYFGISPRLAITSPEKGCGKTTLLDVLARLVMRPLSTTNVTPAAIFRIVDLKCPALLIDEADTFLADDNQLRGILNSGHRKGGEVIRTVGEDFEPRAFKTYAACAIAIIGKLPGTLADRSIPINLRRRRSDERVEEFRFDRTTSLDQLARKVARWAKDNAKGLRGADPDMPIGVFNRMADNWRPLLAIADAVGGEWPARARAAAQSFLATADDDQSARVILLSDIRDVLALRGNDRIASADLVSALIGLEERPWAEWKSGKAISANGLARLLAPFGIQPSTIRIGDETPKGYMVSQFEDAFARYLASGVEDFNRHNATSSISPRAADSR